jgi:MYXO-CTERM domain-containing protein
MPVKVCFAGAQPMPMPDAGPNAGPCTVDEDCPSVQHCDTANSVCTFECRNSEDCATDETCDGRGRCRSLDGGGGCGCRTGGPGGALAMFALLLLVRRRR